MTNKKKSLIFILAFTTTLFALPLMYALGLPSFDIVLTALFGKGSILAVILSVSFIAAILFGVRKSFQVRA